MLAAFQILSGLFLLWYLILPGQNYELISWLSAGSAGIWLLFLLLCRSRALLSTSVFFYFCLLLSFHVRAAASAGWMIHWYMLFLFTQWGIVLWFVRHNEFFEASLFLTIVVISPFYWHILNVRNPTFFGFSLWIFSVVHSFWLLPKENQLRVPRSILALLFVSLIPIPFALYSWRAIQFFWIQAACVFVYCVIAFSGERKIKPLISGFLFLTISIAIYTFFNDLLTIRQAGIGVLAVRHHVLEHANTLAPLYIIFSTILLYLFSKCETGSTRILIAIALVLLAVLESLTYSRNGWMAYLLFIATYALLLFLRNSERRAAIIKTMAMGFVSILLLVILLAPVRRLVFDRLVDDVSISSRIFTWKLGWNAVQHHPFFGTGWFNYYAHAAEPADKPLTNLALNSEMRDVHNHSLFLDLAEAGGIPLVAAFIGVLLVHFVRTPHSIPLLAGLIGVTLNNILDTASLWLTVYPHFWIVLALTWMDVAVQKTGRILKTMFLALSILLLFGPGISSLLEDHYLQKSNFLHLNNRDAEAIKAVDLARMVAPFDVVPLERLKDIHLSRSDVAAATTILKNLMDLKKDYAPYYTDLARISGAKNDFDRAFDFLKKAQQLDPYMSLQGRTYLVLSDIQRRRGSPDYEQNLYRYLTTRLTSRDFKALELIDTIQDTQFLTGVYRYIEQNTETMTDREFAFSNLYENLLIHHNPALAERVLQEALRQPSRLPAYVVDNFAYILSRHYAEKKLDSEIERLFPYPTIWAADLVRAHHAIARNNLPKAREHMERALRLNFYIDIADSWEMYFRAAGREQDLRSHFKTLQRIPTQHFSPRAQDEIARSYEREKMYRKAAAAFHKLAFFDYSNPTAHWLIARMLWMSGDSQGSANANERFNRLISSNKVYQNLYMATIVTHPGQHVNILRSRFENEFGGQVWRTGIFAHPRARLTLPVDIRFQSLKGQIGMVDGAWFEETDGFELIIENDRGLPLVSASVHPKDDPHQNWIAFEWQGAPQSLVLRTEPRSNPNYDWTVISFDSVR